MRNRYQTDLNRLIKHPRGRAESRPLRQLGGLDAAFSTAKGLEREPLILDLLYSFATIPRSDDAPDGWGLPDDGGIGTAGGSSPWITLATTDYSITRFQDLAVGNLYWKGADASLPVLSWVGPQNGLVNDGDDFNTYNGGNGAPSQASFTRDLFSGGKKIAECESTYVIAGACIVPQGGGYRIYIMVLNAATIMRLDYADVPNLSFDTLITTWSSIALPQDNTRELSGDHKADGLVAFNQAGTHCAWVWSNVIYEWEIGTAGVTMRDDINADFPANYNPFKPYYNVTYDPVLVADPCGGGGQWVKSDTVTESLNQDWYQLIDRSKQAIAVDYINNSLTPVLRETGTRNDEVFNYTSTRTHSRPEICNEPMPQVQDSVSFSGNRSGYSGIYFTVNLARVTKSDDYAEAFSGGPGELRDYTVDENPGNTLMRNRVGDPANVTSEDRTQREVLVRFIDVKAGVAVISYGEIIYQGLDAGGDRSWLQQRRNCLLVDGQEIDFFIQDLGVAKESDITNGGQLLVPDPAGNFFQFHIATSRDSAKVFASITDNVGNLMLNYLTGADPVVLTGVTGTNPRFRPVGLI